MVGVNSFGEHDQLRPLWLVARETINVHDAAGLLVEISSEGEHWDSTGLFKLSAKLLLSAGLPEACAHRRQP